MVTALNLPIVYVAPSTVNVAARHLLKNRVANPTAEFLRLEETRRIGESGQEEDLFTDADTDEVALTHCVVVGSETWVCGRPLYKVECDATGVTVVWTWAAEPGTTVRRWYGGERREVESELDILLLGVFVW